MVQGRVDGGRGRFMSALASQGRMRLFPQRHDPSVDPSDVT
jgi:hypothetical protein